MADALPVLLWEIANAILERRLMQYMGNAYSAPTPETGFIFSAESFNIDRIVETEFSNGIVQKQATLFYLQSTLASMFLSSADPRRWIDYTKYASGTPLVTQYAGQPVGSGPGQGGNVWTMTPEIAGLHPTLLWRRYNGEWPEYPDDPTFQYGVAQVGDVWGRWIIEDLQAACRAMRFVSTGWNMTTSAPKKVTPAGATNKPIPEPTWRTKIRNWALYEFGDPGTTLDLTGSGTVAAGVDIPETLAAEPGFGAKDYVIEPDFTYV